ncbi:MAG TPA: TIGR02302 family protein, partial [Stellaceae bacterium]|nr:TIGR02302 family protein [Stellaceae bacterium]
GAIDAGGEWRDRFARAVAPHLEGGAGIAATSFDLWLTPPEYTGLAPQFLRPETVGPVKVPAGSVLLAQVHGGDTKPRLAIDRDDHEFAALDKQNFRLQTTLNSGTTLTLSQGGEELGRWPIEIVPDNPPTVAFSRPPSATARAALRLDYRADDDYGVESVKAVISRPGDNSGETIELDLPLPGLHLKSAEATSYHDLTPHPWAGLPVEIRLAASDAKGQRGESAPVKMVLPEREFHNPVARAIIDERKELNRDPTSAEAVAEILGDLNTRPALYHDDAVVYLALRFAQQQLRRDNSKDLVGAVGRLLWDTALRIEDGTMSLAERDLRQLQQRLQDALAKGAPDAEIERLMQQLQQALDRYMQSLAQQLQRQPNNERQPFDPSRTITSRDLRNMLDRARELARNGDREQARQLLAQLQNMLENLRAARPGEMQRGAAQAQQMMRGLEDMMQRQQQLLDRSFRAQNRQGQNGRNGQQAQPRGPQSGQQSGNAPGDEGQLGEFGDEAGQQEGLRRQLGEVMRQLGTGMGDIPAPFGRAERAMRDATGALQRGRPGQAIAPQTEALDQLQQAARDFARQLRQRFGDQMGVPSGGVGATNRDPRQQGERDPFGRPTSNGGTYDLGYVKIPDQSVLQKSREILDELRRRAGERSRPQIELDYIDRLLKRF